MTIQRRGLLAAAAPALAVIGGSALAGTASSPWHLYPVLLAIIAAWKTQDVEGVLAHVTDDIIWQNSGGFAPAIQGKAQMRAALQGMAPHIAESHWRIFDYAEVSERLFSEGVDEFVTKTGARVAIPYACVQVFRGSLIAEWREYFDGRLLGLMKAGPVPASVEALIHRPIAQ